MFVIVLICSLNEENVNDYVDMTKQNFLLQRHLLKDLIIETLFSLCRRCRLGDRLAMTLVDHFDFQLFMFWMGGYVSGWPDQGGKKAKQV